MHREPADRIDRELVQEAARTLERRGRAGFHTVGAALLTASGNRYTSLDLRSRKSSICAEPGVIAAAHTSADYELERIVAVYYARAAQRMVVISPCGSCRELIHWHAPNCQIIVEADDQLWRVAAADLFAFADIPDVTRPG